MVTSILADGQTVLPAPPNRLLGRERDCDAISELLRDNHTRLVTLTGPGGVGKTHLAMELAAAVTSSFSDGVVFVSLASVRDPELVLSTIAQALELREGPGQALIELLVGALNGRDTLIVLDNLEQVLESGPDLGVLLAATDRLKFLATSRAPLLLRAEREYPLHPLSPPRPRSNMTASSLESNAAVALFVERSQAVRPSFALTDGNASVVAEICRRLDGLPLAIELAAAMTRVLSPNALLARMEHSLRLLSFGASDLPDRQRTLRNAIAWSHDLLSMEEQKVFRRLAVIADGASLEAIEAVSAESPPTREVFPVVSSLVNKSLLVQVDGTDAATLLIDEPRFRMLATIQEFAAEQLRESDEENVVRRRYLDWLLGLAEEAEQHLTGPDQIRWLQRLDVEHDNIRSALAWALEECQEEGMRLASSLWRYWGIRGLLSEGHTWLCRFLGSSTCTDEGMRAKTFNSLGNLSLDLGDFPAASEAFGEALVLWERLGNTRGVASALNGQGLVDWYRGDYENARRRHEQSLQLRRTIGDRHGEANSLTNMGNTVKDAGDPLAARHLHQQALALRQSLGDLGGVGYSYLNLGDVARRLGDAVESQAMFDRSLRAFREVGDTLGVGYALQGLGLAELLAGESRLAGAYFLEALEIRLGLSDQRGVVESVEGIAYVAASLSHVTVAVTLFGASHSLRDRIEAPLPEPDRQVYDPVLESIRRSLPQATFSSAWEKGSQMALMVAADMAATAARDALEATSAPERPANDLSRREVEVLQLVAKGMTNAQVADQLFLSRRTVDAHLRRIYDKLNLSSRAEVIRFVMDQGLT